MCAVHGVARHQGKKVAKTRRDGREIGARKKLISEWKDEMSDRLIISVETPLIKLALHS